MAKTPLKKAPRKTSPKPAAAKVKKTASVSIEKLSKQILSKLESMKAEPQLQGEIKWCIGSYEYDRNPKGLYETAAKALKYFTEAKAKNAKSVPAKLITDINKALKQVGK